MEILKAAKHIAKELLIEKAKLVILSGSAARGKENPNDLDIAAIFEAQNNLLDSNFREKLIQRLENEVGYKIDLLNFNEKYVNDLIECYNANPDGLRWYLAEHYDDSARGKIKGWPLTWIFGEKSKEKLSPYSDFQTEFIVLEGQEYLETLRGRVK